MPISTRLRTFLGKIEATLGTQEALDGTTGVTNVIEMSRQDQTKFVQVPAQGSFGQRKGLAGPRTGTMNFSLYGCGLGSAGLPTWSSYLKACGGTFTSQTFAPVADNGIGMTAAILRGLSTTAIKQALKGAMGNCVITMDAGMPSKWDFSLTGVIVPDATATLPSITQDTTMPPLCTGNVITVGGTEFVMPSLTIDFGNIITMRQIPSTSGNVAGYLSAWIPNRLMKVRFNPEASGLSTKDWNDVFLSGTTVALVATIGSTTNNIITINAPAMQLSAPPGDGDNDGIYARTLEFQCNQNSDTEDSEYNIVFS